MRRILLSLVFASAVAGLGACARKGPGAAARPEVVAILGDEPVEFEDYAAYVRSAARSEPRDTAPRVASSLLDQYLEERLLALEVEGAEPKPAGATPAERLRDLISRHARLEELTEEVLRKEYAAHPDRYQKPQAMLVSQLLLPNRAQAEEALRMLKAGTPWIEVSRKLSKAPNAVSGGSLGMLAPGDLPREIEKPVWSLPKGALSAPLEAPYGVHVFRVDDRFDERVVPFEEAAPALRLSLAEERSTAAVAGILAAARKRHPVRVLEDHLPFPYVGEHAHATQKD
ncbi:MAG: peptidyl-prolyl cis-trans isomerase [Acidobacteria bacterium]|nr:peptidyl-prolyl cis-trans isomerase [Acidobacteriota bacterium]